jgi:hypothetical protein
VRTGPRLLSKQDVPLELHLSVLAPQLGQLLPFGSRQGIGMAAGITVCLGHLVRLKPVAFAIARVLQCVAPRGVVSNVRTTPSSTTRSLIWRGAPGRGSSNKPATRLATNRARPLHTVVGDIRRHRATRTGLSGDQYAWQILLHLQARLPPLTFSLITVPGH